MDKSNIVAQFTRSDTNTLIESITIYLSKSIQRGDSLTNSTPTRFQAQSKPCIHIQDYLTRLITLSPIPIDGILLGLIYLERITTRRNSEEEASNSRQVDINSLTIHRLILSCLILATKFISDGPNVGRKRLGKVAGVTEIELDHLERDLLFRLDFKLCWSTHEAIRLATLVLHSLPIITTDTPLLQNKTQPITNFRASISNPIIHSTTTTTCTNNNNDNDNDKPTNIRRHSSSSRGIVFVKSQFIDCNLLTRKYGSSTTPTPTTPTRLLELNNPPHSPSISSPSPMLTTQRPVTPKSTSKIIVTKLEHKQVKICHTQVF